MQSKRGTLPSFLNPSPFPIHLVSPTERDPHPPPPTPKPPNKESNHTDPVLLNATPLIFADNQQTNNPTMNFKNILMTPFLSPHTDSNPNDQVADMELEKSKSHNEDTQMEGIVKSDEDRMTIYKPWACSDFKSEIH